MAEGFTSATALDAIYGDKAAKRVRDARVLVVGAGGVGCELVKNLACTGFGSITLIDLDTIDVSNLNRQFLFRKHHVGKSKAIEAAASITRMVPGTKIEGLVGNVKESRFGVSFYKRFTVVCNALDNLEARRHVNRMCLAAEVPLVESGSTGYAGQTQVIAKGVECYDCKDKLKQKSYAVCTIRSTPDKPVHCVVWAKFLFDLIFGPDDDGNVLKDLDGDINVQTNGNHDTAQQIRVDSTSPKEANGKLDAQTNEVHPGPFITDNNPSTQSDDKNDAKKSKAKRIRYGDGENSESFSARVCTRVFVDDIRAQIAMKDLWKERSPPNVFDVNFAADEAIAEAENIDLLNQSVWTKEKSAAIFKTTVKRIIDRRSAEIGALTFDKDDPDAMMFVSSASNLRSHAYGVPLQSPFAIKGIAGNIVHAIATTNAMVGGLVVLEALKITTNQGNIEKCRSTYVTKLPSGCRVRKILSPESLKPPNGKCFVCSKGQPHLTIDVRKTTLRTFIRSVLQKKMSMIEPTVFVTTGDFNNSLYECGDGLEDDEVELYRSNLNKTLFDLRVENGSQLLVDDFAQHFTCTMHVTDANGKFDNEPEGEKFSLDGEVPEKTENGVVDVKDNIEVADLDEDDAMFVPVSEKAASVLSGNADPAMEVAAETIGKKRTLEGVANGNGEERGAKRARAEGDVSNS